jgi:beta-catenin-like protein 1
MRLATRANTTSQDELYKAAKTDSNGDVKSKGKSVMVEDEAEDDDGEAGPEMPPDFDQEDVPDDEEGRFFGGGMEQKTAQAMQYIDQQEEEEAAVCHFPWLGAQ